VQVFFKRHFSFPHRELLRSRHLLAWPMETLQSFLARVDLL
jgi:hypothetical protein